MSTALNPGTMARLPAGWGGKKMNLSASARLIAGLRTKGWNDTEIIDFLLWLGTGEEQYRPKGDKPK